MGDFDNFFNSTDQLEGTDYTFRDLDTLRDGEGNLFRIQGIDAPEIAKVDPKTGLPYSAGTAGGGATQDIMDLANSYGYNNVVKTGEFSYGRELIKLQDKDGRDFASTILRNGILDPNRFATTEQALTSQVGDIWRSREEYEDTDWDRAREGLDDAIEAETFYDAGFKAKATTERDLANDTTGEYSSGYVQFRNADRNLANKANSPWKESVDLGLKGVQEASWGVLNLVGETTDWDWAADLGEQGVGRAQLRIADKPDLKLSAFDADGNWDIDSAGEFFQYTANNIGVSLPYIAFSIAGAAATPFVGVSALGVAATGVVLSESAVYTGQVWNEQEGDNKNAGLAVIGGVSQAVLNRVGLGFLVKGGVNILKKETLEAATKALAKQKGITTQAAQKILAGETRKEIAKLAGDAAKVAGEQLAARNVLKALAARVGTGAATEGLTESMQEVVGYLAAHSVEGANWVELKDRVLNAAVAGSSIGGGFSVAGTAYDAGQWADAAVGTGAAEAKRAAWQQQEAQRIIERDGRVTSNVENAQAASESAKNRKDDVDTLTERRARAKADRGNRTGGEVAVDLVTKGIPKLFRRATASIFTDSIQKKSEAARKLAEMFGANLDKVYSGAHNENAEHHRVTTYRQLSPDALTIAEQSGNKKFRGKGGIDRISREIVEPFAAWVIANEKNGTDLNWDSLPANLKKHRHWLPQFHQKNLEYGDKLYNDQVKFNPKLGYRKNYAYHFKGVNKAAIEKSQPEFEALLRDEYGYSQAEATQTARDFIEIATINSDEDFHVGAGASIPGSHKARTLNLADNPKFHKFMDQNFFNNQATAGKSAARYVTGQEFRGEENAIVNELLQQMEEQGHSRAEVDAVADGLQDYFDAQSGNYKRIQNQNVVTVQRNLMTWTAVSGLPLATVSSLVEYAFTAQALTMEQIKKVVAQSGADGAKGMWSAMKRWESPVERERAKRERQAEITDLGFNTWETGAATTTGVTETSNRSQKFMDFYFRAIGLQQWTDFTRQMRASIFGDWMENLMSQIEYQRSNNELYSNDIQQAESQLRDVGINIEDMITLRKSFGDGTVLTDAQTQVIKDNLREGQFNFVNQAIALPLSYNRPLFYQNPHLALFTQFQGFIATFTANQIPRLWKSYVARGTPAMKYNAFAVMTTAIALGFASQYLKDLLKYGEASPYLDDDEFIQRALGASGLLGTGERVLGFVNPIYETRSDGPLEWFFNTLSGEAAATTNISRVIDSAGSFASGDAQQGIYKGLKTAPFIGPFTNVNQTIAAYLTGKGGSNGT